jgi:serine/threonine protein kinase/Tfp pilus assembly protein PilF
MLTFVARVDLAPPIMTPNPPPADRLAAAIIQSWLDGTAAPDAAAALAKHPELATDKALALDLAFAEFLLREHRGEQLDPDEFCARFPDYHASLGRMLAQQSIRDRADLDAVLPGGLAQQTINVDVQPLRGTDLGAGSPKGNEGPIASQPPTQRGGSPGSGSSVPRPGNPAWPEPGGRVGDFKLLRQLGKGAFGRVFLAVEQPTDRDVVVKISKKKCDEAKVLGRLGHRNVVAVLSAPHDVATGLYLVVMPYLGSATLEDLLEVAFPLRRTSGGRPARANVIATATRRNLRPSDPIPKDQMLDPFLQRAGYVDGIVWLGVRIADALAAVHQCHFVHHDLKPSNVLLGLDGQPRLLDFNLASDARNAKSRLGGTLPYMPPEHLNAVRNPDPAGGQMDARGDVYSLGVILYELLTGTHPFGRFPKSKSVRTAAEEMLARQKQGVRPIRERNPDVRPRLARLVERCLAFDPADRPPTASAVADELRRCYSVKKQALQFFGTRPGRMAVTATTVGLVSAATWLASAQGRPRPVDYRALGMSAVADGKYASAIPTLITATEQNPNDAEAWLNLGRARLAQREWQAARPALEKAAQLRPGHGPTHATLAWDLGKIGLFEQADAALQRAEAAGYSPAGLHVLRAYCRGQVSDYRAADAAVASALAIDPNNRAALANRAQQALNQAMARLALPPDDVFAAVDRMLAAGPVEPELEVLAARFYGWAVNRAPTAKVWYPDPAGAKARSLALLRQAVEHGAPELQWNNTMFKLLFGDPKVYARDWAKPAAEITPSPYWLMGDPLVEFPG